MIEARSLLAALLFSTLVARGCQANSGCSPSLGGAIQFDYRERQTNLPGLVRSDLRSEGYADSLNQSVANEELLVVEEAINDLVNTPSHPVVATDWTIGRLPVRTCSCVPDTSRKIKCSRHAASKESCRDYRPVAIGSIDFLGCRQSLGLEPIGPSLRVADSDTRSSRNLEEVYSRLDVDERICRHYKIRPIRTALYLASILSPNTPRVIDYVRDPAVSTCDNCAAKFGDHVGTGTKTAKHREIKDPSKYTPKYIRYKFVGITQSGIFLDGTLRQALSADYGC
jgi:hypothetical protein